LLFRIPQPGVPPGDRSSLWGEFQGGVRLVWDHPGLRRLYGLLGAVVLVVMPSFTLVPLLVKEHFGGGAGHVAVMEGVAGAAMLAGGLLVAAFPPRRPMPWILSGLAGSCFALALAALMPAQLFWAAVLWWGVSGVAFVIGDAPMMALLQSSIPHHQQGRALSLMTAIMGLAAPVGLAVVSPIGELVGTRWLFVLLGMLAGCMTLAGFWSRPLRRFGQGMK
jgi:DHA3 family macrolide efflux protein-like MFS transporter